MGGQFVEKITIFAQNLKLCISYGCKIDCNLCLWMIIAIYYLLVKVAELKT